MIKNNQMKLDHYNQLELKVRFMVLLEILVHKKFNFNYQYQIKNNV